MTLHGLSCFFFFCSAGVCAMQIVWASLRTRVGSCGGNGELPLQATVRADMVSERDLRKKTKQRAHAFVDNCARDVMFVLSACVRACLRHVRACLRACPPCPRPRPHSHSHPHSIRMRRDRRTLPWLFDVVHNPANIQTWQLITPPPLVPQEPSHCHESWLTQHRAAKHVIRVGSSLEKAVSGMLGSALDNSIELSHMFSKWSVASQCYLKSKCDMEGSARCGRSTVTPGFKSIMARPSHCLITEFKKEQLAILSTVMPQSRRKLRRHSRGMHRTRLSVRPSDASSRGRAQWTSPRLRRGRRKMITSNSVRRRANRRAKW